MQNASTTSTAAARFSLRAVALSFAACFLFALTGIGMPVPTPASGEAAFANHKTGVATVPRQGTWARVSATSQREHAKSQAFGGALGLAGVGPAVAFVIPTGPRIARTSPARSPYRAAHYARGPPRLAS